MNTDLLQKKLIAAARANPPGEGVPYAFEKRVMALLSLHDAGDSVILWVRGLWRAAVSCMAIAVLFGAWAFFTPATNTNTVDLSQNFANTLLAAVDQSAQAQ